jgi:hypothetical protein
VQAGVSGRRSNGDRSRITRRLRPSGDGATLVSNSLVGLFLKRDKTFAVHASEKCGETQFRDSA